jgi:predicted acyl esterase
LDIMNLMTLHTWSPGRRSTHLRICALAFALALGALAAIGPAVARTAYPGGKWEPGPARYGTVVADDVTITMDDGVVLEVSIAYPTHKATGHAPGRFPMLVEHSPYVQLGAQSGRSPRQQKFEEAMNSKATKQKRKNKPFRVTCCAGAAGISAVS